MIRSAFLFCWLLCCFALQGYAQKFEQITTPAGYQYPADDSLVVVSWNVEHFVNQYDNPYIKNDREDKPNLEDFEKRKALLAQALQTLNPDIVVLQEFEHIQLLKEIADTYLKDQGYRFYASDESPDWYMNVVLMSKVPLGVLYSYGHLFTAVPGTLNKEGLPETQNNVNTRMWTVEVQARPGFAFYLTGLHLKAGREDRDKAMRQGQIQFLSAQFNRFLKEDKKTKMLICGDLNATPDSDELRYWFSPPAKMPQFVDPLAGTAVFSHPSEAPERRIDHILPNIALSKYLLSTEVVLPLPSESMQAISDHLPVRAVFLVK
jgi:endonuclease/exonuclease/phosphatase family metal-dependent hydrolase